MIMKHEAFSDEKYKAFSDEDQVVIMDLGEGKMARGEYTLLADLTAEYELPEVCPAHCARSGVGGYTRAPTSPTPLPKPLAGANPPPPRWPRPR